MSSRSRLFDQKFYFGHVIAHSSLWASIVLIVHCCPVRDSQQVSEQHDNIVGVDLSFMTLSCANPQNRGFVPDSELVSPAISRLAPRCSSNDNE